MVKILLQILLWSLFMAALIFWPAGTFAYPGAWAFIVLFLGGGLAMVWWLAKYSPSLLRERMGSPIQHDQKPWDRIWLSLFILGFCLWMAFMSWDAARTGFIAMPLGLQVLGGIAIAAYTFGAWWTFRENSFAAPVVKIQEGQRVIDTGPYAFVRHPMYASAVLLFIGIPLLLGSWLGLALSIVFILSIAWRGVREERVLRDELPGYDDYARRVHYRLLPGIW